MIAMPQRVFSSMTCSVHSLGLSGTTARCRIRRNRSTCCSHPLHKAVASLRWEERLALLPCAPACPVRTTTNADGTAVSRTTGPTPGSVPAPWCAAACGPGSGASALQPMRLRSIGASVRSSAVRVKMARSVIRHRTTALIQAPKWSNRGPARTFQQQDHPASIGQGFIVRIRSFH